MKINKIKKKPKKPDTRSVMTVNGDIDEEYLKACIIYYEPRETIYEQRPIKIFEMLNNWIDSYNTWDFGFLFTMSGFIVTQTIIDIIHNSIWICFDLSMIILIMMFWSKWRNN